MPNMPLIKIKFQVYPNKVYKKNGTQAKPQSTSRTMIKSSSVETIKSTSIEAIASPLIIECNGASSIVMTTSIMVASLVRVATSV